jgi:cytochrome b pre-mRNA-processing protein 3
MLNFLFRRLTTERFRGVALFDWATARARQPHWYVEGHVPDTLEGRFAMLATITALALTRLEQLGDAAKAASVALTERYIAVRESEHRELGIGDPALGKQVRRLVGSLARRVGLWRDAISGSNAWLEAARQSVYTNAVAADALAHSSAALEALWARLEAADLESLIGGNVD